MKTAISGVAIGGAVVVGGPVAVGGAAAVWGAALILRLVDEVGQPATPISGSTGSARLQLNMSFVACRRQHTRAICSRLTQKDIAAWITCSWLR